MPPPEKQASGGNSFVIQEHHATALHWDLRLERDGVLVSWAVPKGVPTDPKINRLAVHVDDHPLDYGGYEGTISHGEYGGGRVTIWDRGTYTTEKWTDREVKVVLDGGRVQGRFVLFQTGGKNWMMHRMDGPPRPDWQTLPTYVEPMYAEIATLPRARGWAFEMAWPGIRAQVRVEGGRVDIAAADGGDIGPSFPELSPMGAQLGAAQVLLDGVLVHFGEDGRLDSEVLARRFDVSRARARALARTEPAVYLAFDLLHRDGSSLLATPYRERRAGLDELEIAGASAQVPPAFEGSGRQALQTSRDQQLAGVIAKRLTSTYQPGVRSHDWISVVS